GDPAVLRLDAGCAPCSVRCHPAGLAILPANGQVRAEYRGGDGHPERGVAAVARRRAAAPGPGLRRRDIPVVPGTTWLAQLATDAMIAPPHAAGGERCPTPSGACSTARSPRSGSTASPASPPAPSPPPPG